jgi:hypothetical protein
MQYPECHSIDSIAVAIDSEHVLALENEMRCLHRDRESL